MRPIRSLLVHILAVCGAIPSLHCSATVSSGVADASEVSDAPDADDLPDIVDAPDASDVFDASDTPDAREAATCDASISGSVCSGTTAFFSCGLPPGATPGEYFDSATCDRLCTPLVPSMIGWWRCSVMAGSDVVPASITCYQSCPIDGRRPEGFALPAAPEGLTPLQSYLAASASLECAAITAFERLASELAHHGAPASLIERAMRAADDERRHTAVMCDLARRHGVEVTPVAPPVEAPRPLLAVARENAVEGCVRETYAALLAGWQSKRATDPHVARAYASIADDETRHAQLSWDVSAWIESRLRESGRARLREARREAFLALLDEMTAPVHPSLIAVAGVPRPADAARLIEMLDAGLEVEAA